MSRRELSTREDNILHFCTVQVYFQGGAVQDYSMLCTRRICKRLSAGVSGVEGLGILIRGDAREKRHLCRR